jgi:capsular polysaccharide biosynthesis protein
MTAAAPALTLVAEAEAFGAARLEVYPDGFTTEPELEGWTRGKFGGTPVPEWVLHGAEIGGVRVQTAAPAMVWPQFGMVADARRRVFRSTAWEVVTSGYDLERFAGDVPAERLGPVAVALPFGSVFNYGHYLLDGLTSLQALHDAGALADRPVVTDPLTGWRRELIDLAFPGLARRETAAVMVAVESATFADSMDHYLHRCGEAALRLRARLLEQLGPRAPTPERVYVSRRGSNMRLLVNEAALEAALVKRGFTIIHPEALPVRGQLELFRGARVVLGATGAGLANALVAAPECCVMELLPGNFSAGWVRNLCFRVGCDWRGWFAPSPLTGWREWPYRRRPGFRFAWRLELQKFLPWLDRQLAGLG